MHLLYTNHIVILCVAVIHALPHNITVAVNVIIIIIVDVVVVIIIMIIGKPSLH